jgi:uncharacterized protein YjbI with pentapeptide repeats
MKLLAAAAALALMAAPAIAQNAGQISASRGGASCPGCNLFQADFSNLEMRGRNFNGARLRQSNLSLAVMNGSNFSGADLRDVDAFGGVFSGSNFSGANLENSSWVGAYLGSSRFRGANLAGANFSGAEMDHASGLTQAQLDQACGDQATTLPGGLRIPLCR